MEHVDLQVSSSSSRLSVFITWYLISCCEKYLKMTVRVFSLQVNALRKRELVPQPGRDMWDSNFVRMPCSKSSVIKTKFAIFTVCLNQIITNVWGSRSFLSILKCDACTRHEYVKYLLFICKFVVYRTRRSGGKVSLNTWNICPRSHQWASMKWRYISHYEKKFSQPALSESASEDN